jgi:hypothetical protein
MNKGQESVEFIVIGVLILLTAYMVFLMLGKNLSEFFSTQSAASKVSLSHAPVVKTNALPKYMPDYQEKLEPENISIGEYDAIMNPDRTLQVNIAGQDITLPSEVLALQSNVMQTTGASGLEILLSQMATLIQNLKPEYPDSAVPLELSYGDGTRIVSAKDAEKTVYSNESGVNAIAIRAGNKITIIQKDQTCTGECFYVGTYIIEGEIDNNNNYVGQVVSSDNKTKPTGTYYAKVDTSNGMVFYDAYYQEIGANGVTTDYEWNLVFDNADNVFNLN